MEFYSTIKNDYFTKFVGKLSKLENIILSEVPKTQKAIHGKYSPISGYSPKSSEYPQYNLKIICSLRKWNAKV